VSRSPGDAPLRVAVDATALLASRTGVRVFCEEALAALGRREDVEVLAFAVTWRRRQLLPPLLPPRVKAVQCPMPARPINLAWRHAATPPIELFVGRAGVVHGTNYTVPPAARAARVVTVHDLTPLRYPELSDGRTPRFVPVLRRAIAAGAWVHVPSNYVAGEVVEAFGADPSRVRAVHHGIPGQGLQGATVASTQLQLPPGTRRYIVAVGTVEPRKDYPTLVRAFDALASDRRDLALVLVGPDGWGTAALEGALAACRARDRVVRCGFLSAPDRDRTVAASSALAYTSLYEGFGFPTLEAMRDSVPVVATAVGAIPEVVGDAALLVPPADADSLAGALARVLDDEEVRAELVARGRQRALCFSWDACAQGLVRLYAEAASS
jgi:glycosyltransferase involved in cell wall biosynthesis